MYLIGYKNIKFIERLEKSISMFPNKRYCERQKSAHLLCALL